MNYSHHLPNHKAFIDCQQHNMTPFMEIRNKSFRIDFSVEQILIQIIQQSRITLIYLNDFYRHCIFSMM
ncbi:hypothetical protein MNBD_GAMMA20-425 [hydrothermal vent metagenome]|uniref:Uncharacterized protein n=1 Tax=hydrothermal vent metagenome TaxID=652676 RepID=A0A3B1AC39_9ZZZZ